MSLLAEMYESGSMDESLYGFVKRTIKKFTPGRTLATAKAKQRRFLRGFVRGLRKSRQRVVKAQSRHFARQYVKAHGRKAFGKFMGPRMAYKG